MTRTTKHEPNPNRNDRWHRAGNEQRREAMTPHAMEFACSCGKCDECLTAMHGAEPDARPDPYEGEDYEDHGVAAMDVDATRTPKANS